MRRLRRVTFSAEFLVDILKHGVSVAQVVDNALPEDATYEYGVVDQTSGQVWLFVSSASFDEVPEGAAIPQHHDVSFRRP